MGKNFVKAYFSIFGDSLPVEAFTNEIGITPTESYHIGEEYIRGEKTRHRYTSIWNFSSGVLETDNVTEQLDKVIDTLSPYVGVINKYKKEYNLECMLYIVLNYSEYQTPGLQLKMNHIRFAENVEAEFDIDIYNGTLIEQNS